MLALLSERWEKEATVHDWVALGAPGSPAALKGLADTRRKQVEQANDAGAILYEALSKVGPAAPTKTEAKEASLQ